MTEYYSYITKDGDRWDLIANKFYKNPSKYEPIIKAKANIIRETIDAINLWETRVKVNKTEVEINGSTILIKVEWTLAKGKTSGAVEVTL